MVTITSNAPEASNHYSLGWRLVCQRFLYMLLSAPSSRFNACYVGDEVGSGSGEGPSLFSGLASFLGTVSQSLEVGP